MAVPGGASPPATRIHHLVHRPVLLVAAHLLDGLAAARLKDDEMSRA